MIMVWIYNCGIIPVLLYHCIIQHSQTIPCIIYNKKSATDSEGVVLLLVRSGVRRSS